MLAIMLICRSNLTCFSFRIELQQRSELIKYVSHFGLLITRTCPVLLIIFHPLSQKAGNEKKAKEKRQQGLKGETQYFEFLS